ncbi:hypothetical protein [Devosia ginsengisoli]|uniref:hypothetical protein n=1 Tax=Devosia ginsengisoli TaxID=400770 RepID=UPI0026EF8232|nr:hypothetical protein [Devosia ginsengisoli]MCR6656534.1 hypothetical protein [Opitutus sp.]MCR6670973.1 hypothetical protein [Devosia ginsengisoli]
MIGQMRHWRQRLSGAFNAWLARDATATSQLTLAPPPAPLVTRTLIRPAGDSAALPTR